MIFIAAIPVFIYLMLIGFYFFCWSKLPDFSSMQKSLTTKVSVLVAVRNEEDNLPILTTCLKNQNFPKELLEIIFVNDNSTDRTEEVIRNSFLRGEINHQVISLSKNESGKKTAITKGVANASGDLIITTDADCRMDADWISTIVSFYEQAKPVLIVMPVLLKAKTFFEEMQALEILSLTATTASSLAAGFPLMCNGANLAFEKKCFDDAYSSNKNIPTGDDTFLMFQLHDKFKNRVVYLKSKSVIVKTNPENNLSSFLHQRIRWTSKVKHYNKPHVTLIGILIFVVALFQVSFLFLTPSIHSIHELFFIAILLFVPKAIIDFSYLRKVGNYFSEKFSMPVFLLWQIIYPFYIIIISALSLFSKYEWKGRKY